MKLKTLVLAAALMACAFAAQAITIDMVPVGNPGNAGELSGAGAGGIRHGPYMRRGVLQLQHRQVRG